MRMLQTLMCTLAVSAAGLVASTGAYAQSAFGAPLFAVLVGNNECDAAAVCKKGDPDAIGSATIILPDNTRVCWAITIDNLKGATLAHIHRGTPANNGGIVVALTPPNAPFAGNPGASSGCVAVAGPTIAAIRADPTSFYVNVHNGDFPGGAARGQLH